MTHYKNLAQTRSRSDPVWGRSILPGWLPDSLLSTSLPWPSPSPLDLSPRSSFFLFFLFQVIRFFYLRTESKKNPYNRCFVFFFFLTCGTSPGQGCLGHPRTWLVIWGRKQPSAAGLCSWVDPSQPPARTCPALARNGSFAAPSCEDKQAIFSLISVTAKLNFCF